MDIHMPGMDGFKAAGAIHALYTDDARPGAGRSPIVALIANAFAEDQVTYLAAGLDDYIAKPFEKKDLAALLFDWRIGGPNVEEGAAWHLWDECRPRAVPSLSHSLRIGLLTSLCCGRIGCPEALLIIRRW